jgi:amino acid exporter
MGELSLYLPGILLAYSACLLGLASPGPNVLAVLGTAMGEGRRAGIALALGIATGSVLWALLTAAGLSALLATYAAALTAIKIAGGFYLLWLAFKAFRAAASAHAIATTVHRQRNSRAYLLRGLAIQMTNPKAVLAWIAIMSLGLRHDAPLWVVGAIVVGTSVLSFAIHYLYAVAFSTPTIVRLYGRARRAIQATLGVFFGFAGVNLLASR